MEPSQHTWRQTRTVQLLTAFRGQGGLAGAGGACKPFHLTVEGGELDTDPHTRKVVHADGAPSGPRKIRAVGDSKSSGRATNSTRLSPSFSASSNLTEKKSIPNVCEPSNAMTSSEERTSAETESSKQGTAPKGHYWIAFVRLRKGDEAAHQCPRASSRQEGEGIFLIFKPHCSTGHAPKAKATPLRSKFASERSDPISYTPRWLLFGSPLAGARGAPRRSTCRLRECRGWQAIQRLLP